MKVFSSIVIAFSLVSCAQISYNNVNSPYEQFTTYVNLIQAKEYDSALLMLSSKNKQRFANQENGEDFATFFPFFSSANTVVVNEYEHYQQINDLRACLTVSGSNSLKEPTSLNFEMLQENGEWKFNYIHMAYHGSKDELPITASCPEIP
jgi:hypothetical protein